MVIHLWPFSKRQCTKYHINKGFELKFFDLPMTKNIIPYYIKKP